MSTIRHTKLPSTIQPVFTTSGAILATILGVSLASSANADISLEFFSVSTYNTNTAAMNTALGIAGDTIDISRARR